ncbi:hypothetical protein HPB50_006525 [Hyalomma asiaticum]|uniref:Uncharacterized protein n=1 Tax=Hyalomma asiaticum TaxID=266040 RepID=A0ACB7RXA4_HYAAI|nr:hypothetical protein HPB50_006525 [Hyalomma asiaticum]
MEVPDDAAIDVHVKRRLVCKASYCRGLVKKSNVHAWLKHLEQTPLCRHLNVTIDWARVASFDGDNVECDEEDVERLPEITDLVDPLQAAVVLNAARHTVLYDGMAMAIARTAAGEEADATDEDAVVRGLVDNTHSLHLAPGEGRVPISLLCDEYAEELSFPIIYLGVPRAISGPRPTPFSMASSEIRRTDRRGAIPGHDVMSAEEYREMLRLTNPEQYEILREIVDRVTTPDSPPLRVFFTGPAGCGKTFVLRLAMDLYNRYAKLGDDGYNAYVVCASTGKAAVAVGGTTVHAAFKLTLKSKHDGGLNPGELNTFRVAFRSITQELDQPFGELDLILCGDLRQLPPVRANEIYKRCRETDGIFGMTVRWHYVAYFPLVRVVRQADASFSRLLTKIGDGAALDDAEVALLESRFVTYEEAAERAPDAVRLFYGNADVDAYNARVASSAADGTLVRLEAHDAYFGHSGGNALREARAKMAKLSRAETGSHPATILLVVGKPYMITCNRQTAEIPKGTVKRSLMPSAALRAREMNVPRKKNLDSSKEKVQFTKRLQSLSTITAGVVRS